MKSQKKGWRIELLFVFMAILALMALVFFMVKASTRKINANNAKTYFGISSPADLSSSEKAMLEPMVRNTFKRFNQENRDAGIDIAVLLSRNDITPNNADKAVEELRAAQQKEKELWQRLTVACETIKYFSLVLGKLDGCQ